MTDTTLAQQLTDLFRASGAAHHKAFPDTDDVEWPLWYADYLHDPLKTLLNAKFTKSELVYLLVLVAKEQPLRAPGADWPTYYARFFIERYT